MNKATRFVLLTFVLALLSPSASPAQIPLQDDLILAAFPSGAQAEYSPQPVCDAAGVCGFFWLANGLAHNVNSTGILAAAVSSQGAVSVGPKLLATVTTLTGPIAVGLEQGFAVQWDQQFPDGHISPVLRYYDESLTLQKAVTLPFIAGAPGFHNPLSYGSFFNIVRIPSGFELYAGAVDNFALNYSVFVYFIDRDGKSIRTRQRLNEATSVQLSPTSNGLALQPDGDLVAVYWGGDAAFPNVYMRRLTADGKLLGPQRLVNPERHSSQAEPVVASAPDGSFLVVWQRSPAPDTTHDILARRFSAKGQPLGKPFQINNVHQLDQRRPAIAADAQGNYFVVWQSFIPPYNWDVKGRLFRSDGTPITGEVRLNQVRQFEQDFPQVTFSPAGTILAGWESGSLRQRGNEEFVPVARVFSVVPPPVQTDGQEKRP